MSRHTHFVIANEVTRPPRLRDGAARRMMKRHFDSRRDSEPPMNQPDLFGETPPTAKAYVPDPRHIRNRLEDMLAAMRAAESWPWEAVMVKLYRGTVWPYLYEKLPDRAEADGWRQRIEAEIARLDAASA